MVTLHKLETPSTRPNLFSAYIDNMTQYLKLRYPHAPKNSIETFVKSLVETKLVELQTKYREAKSNNEDISLPRAKEDSIWPTVEIVKHVHRDEPKVHSYGNLTHYAEIPLFDIINESRNKIIAPFGTVYETTNNQSAFLKGMIDEKSVKRKKEKKAMLAAKKEGNVALAISHNNNQYTIKVAMNSMPGGMGSGFNFLSSIANFNSVTSISRFFIMNTYAHAERFLESNFYFRTEDQIVDWLVQCQLHGPSDEAIKAIMNKFNLYVPSIDEVMEFISKCYSRYTGVTDIPRIRAMVTSMTDMMRSFVFYMSNAKNLFFFNDQLFRSFVTELFADKYDTKLAQESTPDQVYSIDGDLVIVLSVVHNDRLPKNKKGNSVSIFDTVQEQPELAKEMYARGKYMQMCIDKMQPIFDLFMHHTVRIGYVLEHKNMFRDTVILSDTDSIIFTTKTWLKWWNDSFKIDQNAFNISALIVYYLCKANVILNYNVSRALGALDKDLFAMNAKNEFTMPIEILTQLKKHYMSLLKIQEGVIYGTPQLDIKGVNLRGSNFSKYTLNYSNWFIKDLLEILYQRGKVSAQELIIRVLQFERIVYDSLMAGETKFLTVNPVKIESEYKEAEKGIYFNYLAWEAIFGEKYGHIAIPTKCFVVPLAGIRHAGYEYYLQNNYPEIAKNLHDFLEKYPDKKITRIPINPLIDEIPIELRKIINYKQIIYANARPLYIVLSCLAINLGSLKKDTALFSEMYGWISSEEAKKVIEQIY